MQLYDADEMELCGRNKYRRCHLEQVKWSYVVGTWMDMYIVVSKELVGCKLGEHIRFNDFKMYKSCDKDYENYDYVIILNNYHASVYIQYIYIKY